MRQRGSHVVLKKDEATGSMGCVVPLHRELALGIRGILRQANITPDEFMENFWSGRLGPRRAEGPKRDPTPFHCH